MSDQKPSAGKAEALAKQLKDSLAQRRVRPWKPVLAALILGSAFLALLAWWLYPRPRPGPLQVIALDIVCTTDEVPQARAQLLTPPDDATPRRLSGHTVVFLEMLMPPVPGVKLREIVVKSDDHGQASTGWPIEKPTQSDYLVLHVDEAERRGSPREVGRIFAWPKDSKLLVVDATQALILPDREPDKTALETLVQADKDGWRIVYLCVTETDPHDFRKARGWVEKHAKLPRGPVLGRPIFGREQSAEDARREVLKSLKGRFTGDVAAVVKNAESAQVCKDVGVRPIVVGEAPGPFWADVAAKLK